MPSKWSNQSAHFIRPAFLRWRFQQIGKKISAKNGEIQNIQNVNYDFLRYSNLLANLKQSKQNIHCQAKFSAIAVRVWTKVYSRLRIFPRQNPPDGIICGVLLLTHWEAAETLTERYPSGISWSAYFPTSFMNVPGFDRHGYSLSEMFFCWMCTKVKVCTVNIFEIFRCRDAKYP